jgi:prevent-host-death family protein
MAVLKMTASEFQARPGEALDRSLSAHVIVSKHGRPRNVVLSYEEYDRLIRRDRRAFSVNELTEKELAEIAAAHMEPGYEHLDSEVD